MAMEGAGGAYLVSRLASPEEPRIGSDQFDPLPMAFTLRLDYFRFRPPGHSILSDPQAAGNRPPHNGQCSDTGTTQSIFQRYTNSLVRGFIPNVNELDGFLKGLNCPVFRELARYRCSGCVVVSFLECRRLSSRRIDFAFLKDRPLFLERRRLVRLRNFSGAIESVR